jgi:hypothetical protein
MAFNPHRSICASSQFGVSKRSVLYDRDINRQIHHTHQTHERVSKTDESLTACVNKYFGSPVHSLLCCSVIECRSHASPGGARVKVKNQ